MNLGDLKAFLNDVKSPADRGRADDVRAQLQQEGLRQAREGLRISQTSFSQTSISSNTFVGLRVYNNSLNQTLEVNRQRPNLPAPPNEEEKSTFDFEEVARNVLRFVGGVIKGAAAGGADQEELEKLFAQAEEGVLNGVNLARKDLAGFLNDDIEEGIANSQDLIGQGIEALRRDIFGSDEDDEESVQQGGTTSVAVEQSVSFRREDSGALTIRTRDGDEVSIRFEDLQEFEYNRSLLIESNTQSPQQGDAEQTAEEDTAIQQPNNQTGRANDPSRINVQAQPEIEAAPEQSRENDDDEDDDEPAQTESQVDGNVTTQTTDISLEESYQLFERSGLSFSVQGDLDADEIRAIGQLVGDTADLARDFFDGDVDAAFEQALELGFDERELTGFALQLTRFEQTSVVQTYETVSSFNDDNQREELDATQATRPVARYLEKLLDVFDQARNRLEDNGAFEGLLNGLLNQVVDVKTPELIDAINRFNQFNNRLIQNLPRTENE